MSKESKPRRTAAWNDNGTDLTRVLALSDGVFAIAVTLLAIDLIPPEIEAARVSQDLPATILALLPKFFVFALAFYLVIVKWMAHRRVFEHVVRYDSTLLWLNNWFLLLIAFTPVPAAVLGRYPTEPLALIFFGVTQVVTTAVQWLLWVYITRNHQFVDELIDDEMIQFFNWRYLSQIIIMVLFTVLALVNVWLSLAVLVLGGFGFQWYVAYRRKRHDNSHPV